MKSILLRTFVASVTLLGLPASGSSNSPAASTPAANSAALSPNDTDGDPDTGASAGGGDEDGGTIPIVTAVGTDDEMRAQIVEGLVSQQQSGYTIDKTCITAVVARLKAADLQSFRDNFNSPALSPEGIALGGDLNKCLTADSTTTAASTTSAP